MTGISLEHINKSYDGRERAVEDLSLELKPGSFVCLLGPSGCGKTTTLRMIAGLERVDSGSIRAGDQDFDVPAENLFIHPEDRNLGLVFQSYALWPHMTVEDNVAFGLKMRKASPHKREKLVSDSLAQLRMEQYRKRYPAELSGGQQQRVALARMLAIEPEILLLDEPLSNLDAALRLEMRSELKRLHARLHNTIVFVTHDQLEAMSLATDIAVMSKGKLEQYDTPMNVYRKPSSAFVAKFVGNPPMNMISFHEGSLEPWMYKFRDETAARRSIDDPKKISCIGFRSEDAVIGGSNDTGLWWSQKVYLDTVLPTGPETVLSLMAGNFSIYLVTGQDCTLAAGEETLISIPYEKLHVFDAGGFRI
ncbi:MAG: ABC transporter ATP-binding protein [Treponema sp.]|jgi:iron(III) transport system ATP-binding protein|nr:ABC transporter ATP-binding protein [Treponema sp.]